MEKCKLLVGTRSDETLLIIRCHDPSLFTHQPLCLGFPSQSLSAELATLRSELASQGSKVSRVLGSACGQQCVDDVCRVLPVVLTALSSTEKQIRNLQEENSKQQVRYQR